MSNPHLHSDVMYQILLHLPVKDLCKFRCVSKSWYALISDPIFHRSYRELPIKDRRRILLIPIPVEDRRRILRISNNSTRCLKVDMDGNLEFKDCKSGLSLWSPPFACLDLVCFDYSRGIHLWNPATAEHADIVLGGSNMILGFGYLPSTKEYKILGVVGKDATVITLGEGGMRRRVVNPPPSFPSRILYGEHATVNGMIYLMSKTTFSAVLVIIRFDLERDEWSLLDGPPEFQEGQLWKSCLGNLSGRSSLRNLSGSLCLLRFSDCGRQLMCILKDGIWIKYNIIDISMLIKPWVRGFHGRFPPVIPLDIMEDGRLLLFTELFSRLLYYDSKRCKVLEEIFHDARAELSVDMKQFHPPLLYTEGLTSPIWISRSDDK